MKTVLPLMKRAIPILLISICLTDSCNKSVNLGKFDSQAWQGDFEGCKGVRIEQLVYFEMIKKEFYGMRESQIKELIGHPNRQELGERNRKSYIYHIKNVKPCASHPDSISVILIVDFDALDRANLFTVKAGKF